jgi:hypothetical protein
MSVETIDRSRLADRLDIIELTAKYAYYVDSSDLDNLMTLWVNDDPVFDEEPVGLQRSQGFDAVHDYFRDQVFGKMDSMAHVTTNHFITELTASTARGICTVLAEGDVKGAGLVHVMATYTDAYERVGDTWRFRSRQVKPLTKPQLGGYQP